jgi:hypothetical protein
VLVVAAWLPFGLRTVWTTFRGRPPVLLLAVAAVAYLATQPLRLVPAAHETAARASEFLCLGVALTLALSGLERWTTGHVRSAGRLAVAGLAGFLVMGGFLVGWPPELRLSQPYRIAAGDRTIEPPAVSASRWARSALGQANGIAAEQADARLLQAYGRQRALAGVYPDVEGFLHARKLEPWHGRLIREEGLRYAAVDRRRISADALLGYFFLDPGTQNARPFGVGAVNKLDRERADRLYDNGALVVYDIESLGRGERAR